MLYRGHTLPTSVYDRFAAFILINRDRNEEEMPSQLYNKGLLVFTARCHASAVLAVVVCPSACPSVRHTPVLCEND